MALRTKITSFLAVSIFIVIFFQEAHCSNETQPDVARLAEEYNAEFAPLPVSGPPPPGGLAEFVPTPAPVKDLKKEIQKKKKNWVAGVNPLFAGRNVTDVQSLLGGRFVPVPPGAVLAPGAAAGPPSSLAVRLPQKRGGYTVSLYNGNDIGNQGQRLPSYYDLRRDYPECTSIDSIRTQRGCGGCFAFAATSAMSDRHCIYNYRRTGQLFLSPFHVLSCVPDGCVGGIEWDAMAYWKKKGLVTGGAGDVGANQPDGCLPLPADPSRAATTCPTSCTNRYYSKTFEQDKTFGGASGIKWFPSIDWIQNQIYNFGPVVAFLSVYEDFMYNYTAGVYDYVGGKKLGPHTIKLIGWGREGGVDYWLAVNTWGTGWGERGLFKIRRGANVCQVEARISWALPKEAVI